MIIDLNKKTGYTILVAAALRHKEENSLEMMSLKMFKINLFLSKERPYVLDTATSQIYELFPDHTVYDVDFLHIEEDIALANSDKLSNDESFKKFLLEIVPEQDGKKSFKSEMNLSRIVSLVAYNEKTDRFRVGIFHAVCRSFSELYLEAGFNMRKILGEDDWKIIKSYSLMTKSIF